MKKFKTLLIGLIATLTASLSLGVVSACDISGGHTHSYGDWETIKDATCTKNGEKQRKCSCGEKETGTILAIGHSYSNGVCSVCGTTESGEPDNSTPYPEATEGLEYTLNEDGESYSVTGIGTATDVEHVVIASTYNGLPVTTISNNAFAEYVDVGAGIVGTIPYNVLKSIIIPNSIIVIGDYAFEYCRRLEEVTIPNSVTSIGKGAFNACENLERVIIGGKVTSIGGDVFYYCLSLKEIKYNGIIAEWNAIEKGDLWNSYTGDYTIICTDGTLDKNGKQIA